MSEQIIASEGLSSEKCREESQISNCESAYKGRLREINISPLNTGFVVRLGCQTLAITSSKQLLEELTKYFENPAETEKRYFAGEFGEKNEI
jgi:hypothetical protein